MSRDIEICLIDSTSTLENTFLLPAGPWREPQSRLKTVDMVVEHQAYAPSKKTNPKHFSMWLKPACPLDISGQKIQSNFEGPIHAVAGIGNPKRFFDTCKSLGYEIIEHAFPDHYSFKSSDLDFGDDLPILMTEKDAVKCSSFASGKPYFYLPVAAELDNDFIDSLISRMQA